MRRPMRKAAVAASALALCALGACFNIGLRDWSLVGWSPDSTRQVFALLGGPDRGGFPNRLVMVNLEGEAIRDVAGDEREHELFSPPAWSPDGRWIAYVKIEGLAENDGAKPDETGTPDTVLVSLMLQAADSGEERPIHTARWPQEDFDGLSLFLPPGWSGDSKRLLVPGMSAQEPGLAVVALDGTVVAKVDFEDDRALFSAVLSPDGRYVAYLETSEAEADGAEAEADGEVLTVHVRDLKDGTTREVRRFASVQGGMGLLTWLPDSRFLYLPVVIGEEQDEVGAVRRVSLETGEGQVIWERPGAGAFSLSATKDRAAVEYTISGETEHAIGGIDVTELDGSGSVPVHFGPQTVGCTISPDGQHVAFLAMVDWDERLVVGVIASADGSDLHFFVPEEEEREEIIRLFFRQRVEATLEVLKAQEEIEGATPEHEPPPAERIAAAHRVLDRLAAEHKAPIFREALACMRVGVYSTLLEEAGPDVRRALVPEARARLAEFLRAYPDHPLGPVLGKEIEALAGL